MGRPRRLVFEEFDGRDLHARIGQGDKCVVLLIEHRDYRRAEGAIVFDPATARALGRALLLSARYSEDPA